MPYLTDETMDMMGRDYDNDRYAAEFGVYEAERYVSQFDMELADCIHPHAVEFTTVDVCTYCGEEF